MSTRSASSQRPSESRVCDSDFIFLKRVGPTRSQPQETTLGRGGPVRAAFAPRILGQLVGHVSPTGRIGSRQQLAENPWLVSLGCSGGVQRYCGVHLYIIQLGFEGKPILLKIGRFSLYACGNGVDLPHLAKRAFRDQIGPNVQKAMLPGSPSHQRAEKLRIFSKIFFSFFFSFWRFFCRFLAVGHILRLACFLAVLPAPG